MSLKHPVDERFHFTFSFKFGLLFALNSGSSEGPAGAKRV